MKSTIIHFINKTTQRLADTWLRLTLAFAGAAALLWFLVRVIPKPSRASYPCQRAAFPVATSFVIWLCGVFAIKALTARRNLTRLCAGALTILGIVGWTLVSFTDDSAAQQKKAATDFNFIPAPPNQPVGIARGINPGRVVWARDPLATKWAGNWKQKSDQWWLDENTDQTRVDALLAATLTKLTSTTTSADAWQALFEHYNQTARGMSQRGYQPGEVVAVKINLNNSTGSAKTDNYIDASPQSVLAMVRQLVNDAHVRQQDVLVYDARRYLSPYLLTKVWSEFKDVRFLQQSAPKENQPKHPVYGDYSRLESANANWVEGVEYSNGKYKDAKLIPKAVFDATYIVNLALLKAHSYPYNEKDGGDNGQTGLTMTGKNHFGSIKGTPELHSAINTDQEAVKNAYSPIVDLAASPNLGAKTILFVLDGLYSGRKWQSYPQHFPNPPFNNRTEPYENPDWPASILASMDGVALDSVGLDILFAQTKNNNDEKGRPRILIRANADDYLFEMATPDHAPSGTVYKQGGKVVTSLGVHERWDSDATMRYSRNLDPAHGQGIELIYLPLGGARNESAAAAGTPLSPAVLPGNGLAQHDFFYAGESSVLRMSIVRGGQVVWTYTHPGHGEISDAVLQPNGNILFAHQFGVTEITPDKKVVWNYDAPPNTEIHTAQPCGTNSVWLIQNGNPAKFIVLNKTTGAIENQFALPVKNTNSTHGQFRHARMTDAGTLLVAHMDLDKVCEYDLTGRELWSVAVPNPWSATPLPNGNILAVSNQKFVREINRQGGTVWEWRPADAADYKFFNLQLAWRLANGNTLINQWSGKLSDTNSPAQAIEVTPDKKVVWALRAWTPPADLGSATTIQILDEPATNVTPAAAATATNATPNATATAATTATATATNDAPPHIWPGKGLAQHPFLYAGEWDTRKPDQSMFLVRDGRVVWQYSIPLHLPDKHIQEFDDATLLSDGNIIFSRMAGAGMISPDKKLVWNYDAPPGTEVHSIQSIGKDRVLIMRNGNPAQAMIFNTASNLVEKEIPIPTTIKGTHGQFRHIRMTPTGTILVGHMSEGKVVEYDQTGKEVWSVQAQHPWQAIRLKNGNTLITGDGAKYVREVNPQGETVWELTQADVPDIKLGNIQAANRLASGNTVVCNWIAGDNNQAHWPGTVQVFEVNPAKAVVWALSAWQDPDLGPATSIQLLDEPGTPEAMDQQR